MAANSKHYGDVAIWLEKVLDSCITVEQVDTTRKLIVRFERMYNPKYKENHINDIGCTLFTKSVILRDKLFYAKLAKRLIINE